MRLVIFLALFLTAISFSLWRGGRSQRLVATIFIAAAVGTNVEILAAANNYAEPRWLELAIDFAVLLGLLLVALSEPREWLGWMIALQITATCGHLSRAFQPQVMNWVYYILTAGWAYPMLVLLIGATWQHRRRQRHPNAATFSLASWMRSFLKPPRP